MTTYQRNPLEHILYRYWEGDTLLYIGITVNMPNRIMWHQMYSAWWTRADRIMMERHPDRDALYDAEALAIREEKPEFNRVQVSRSGGNLRNVDLPVSDIEQRIVRERNEGATFAQIARDLTADGLVTRSGVEWNTHRVWVAHKKAQQKMLIQS